jgi:hypothetical protein
MGTDPLTWIAENGKADLQPAPEVPDKDTEEKKPTKQESSARSAPDVLRVHDQPLSRLLADYYVCSHCGMVGGGQDRSVRSRRCSSCQGDIAGARFFFKKPVHVIIDLMQDTYQSTSMTARGPSADIPQLDLGHSLALLLFFCQLFEIVQEHVLRQIMSASRIPEHVANRLLNDNRDPRRRVVKIFPTVTGESWRTAIDALVAKRQIDYVDTIRFLKRAIDLRDTFAVTPDLASIDDDLGKACMLRIHPLLGLYVALHNRYVPLFMRPSNTDHSGEES